MNGYCDAPMPGVRGCSVGSVQRCPDCRGEYCPIHSLRCDFCGVRVCESDIDFHEIGCRDVARKKMPQSERPEREIRRKA